MKRILLGTALAHLAVLSAVADEAGSPAGAATPAPAAPESTGTKIRPNTEGYQNVKTPGGSSTKICGDEVSLALVGATLGEAYGFVSKVVGITEADLRAKYGDKNLGQQRMFLGNLIRGASQSKDEAKKARVGEAFKAQLPAFRETIDARLKKATEEAEAAKAAKQKAKDDAKAEKEAKKKADAEARAKLAEQKKADQAADAAKKAEVKPQANTAGAASAGAQAKAAPAPQAKGPASPAQPK